MTGFLIHIHCIQSLKKYILFSYILKTIIHMLYNLCGDIYLDVLYLMGFYYWQFLCTYFITSKIKKNAYSDFFFIIFCKIARIFLKSTYFYLLLKKIKKNKALPKKCVIDCNFIHAVLVLHIDIYQSAPHNVIYCMRPICGTSTYALQHILY